MVSLITTINCSDNPSLPTPLFPYQSSSFLLASTSCPFTTTCTATECFKAFAHRCTQRPRHPRNLIKPLHAPAFSAGMSHQCFQVSFWPQSSRIAPANDNWPPTTPQRRRPSVSPLPSPTSISPLPVPSPGGTGSQPYPGPVQDGTDIVDDNLESDDSWITDDKDPSTLPSHGGRHSFGARHR